MFLACVELTSEGWHNSSLHLHFCGAVRKTDRIRKGHIDGSGKEATCMYER